MAPRFSNTVVQCGLLESGKEDLLNRLLQVLVEWGLQIQGINLKDRRIVGRIDPRAGLAPCRVTIRLYPREGATLVEAVLAAPRGHAGEKTLAEHAERLRRLLPSVELGNRREVPSTRLRGSSS